MKKEFTGSISQEELNKLCERIHRVPACTVIGLEDEKQAKLLDSCTNYIKTPVTTARARQDIMQQICNVLRFHYTDEKFTNLCYDVLHSKDDNDIDTSFIDVLTRMLDLSPDHFVLHLADCSDYTALGSPFEDILVKIEATGFFRRIHFMCLCNDRVLARKNDALRVEHEIIDLNEIRMQNKNKDMDKKIYLSHKWKTASDTTALLLQRIFKEMGIPCSIDHSDTGFLDSISAYEDELINSELVVAVIDKEYIESLHTMKELVGLFEKDVKKLVPVLPVGRDFLSPDKQHEIEIFWKEELKKRNVEIAKLNGSVSYVYNKEKETIEKILDYIPTIIDYFYDSNVQPAFDYFDNDGIDTFCDFICKRLGIQRQDGSDETAAENSTPASGVRIGTQNNFAEKQINVYGGNNSFNL